MDIFRPMCESYWVIPGRLRAGEYPGAATDEAARLRLRWLLEAGADCFIDLTEQGEPGLRPYDQILAEEASKNHEVAVVHRLPLQDFSTPLQERLVEILDTIDLALSLGKSIYLHCHAGKGRTGTVVGCFLVRHGLSGGDTLERIQELRREFIGVAGRSPETDEQIRMVLEWKVGQ